MRKVHCYADVIIFAIDDNNCEYWYARELMMILEYKRWDKFMNVINKAKISCENSGNNVRYHFLILKSNPKEIEYLFVYYNYR